MERCKECGLRVRGAKHSEGEHHKKKSEERKRGK